MLGRLSKWLVGPQGSRGSLLDESPRLGSGEELFSSAWKRERPTVGKRLREMLESLGHFTGLSTMTTTISTAFNWTAQNNLTGGVYTPITNTGNITKSYKIGTTSANNVSGGGDEVFSFQQAIVAGGTADIDLNAMTNLLNQTSVSIARIKGAQIRLLSAADDSTISPAPTATSTMTVTNGPCPQPSPFWYGNGGSGATVDLTIAAGAVTAVAANQGGSGYPLSSGFLAAPQVSNTVAAGCQFFANANAGGVVTSCAFISGQGGTNYGVSNLPNTPLVPVGQTNIYTGGAKMYFDVSALGFCLVSSTSHKIRLINMDQTHAITAEIDVVGATT